MTKARVGSTPRTESPREAPLASCEFRQRPPHPVFRCRSPRHGVRFGGHDLERTYSELCLFAFGGLLPLVQDTHEGATLGQGRRPGAPLDEPGAEPADGLDA